MIERLRRNIITRWFVINNVNADESEETDKWCRKNVNLEHDKASGPLEAAINRVE